MSVRTVQRHLAAPDLPEIAATNSSLGRSLLDPYKQLLLEWWNAEIRQPKVLMVLLQQQGYTGSERTLTPTVSNGPVEGLNNRLKMLKRQMYGRAELDLLTKRFILV